MSGPRELELNSKAPTLIDLTVHVDDRGSLYEVVREFELPQNVKEVGMPGSPEPVKVRWARFGQTYVVNSPSRGTIRAFHRHQILWDYFCVVHGRAKFVVVDGDPKDWGEVDQMLAKRNEFGITLGIDEQWDFVLGTEKPRVLVVPPLLWHGWEALTDDVVLMCVGTELYDSGKPDEQRIPARMLRDPWGIKAR